MQIEKRKVSDLKFYPGNPRFMSFSEKEKLKRSIQEFGCVDPLIINKNNEVIGGNQRLEILQELGIDEIDCIIIDLSKSKEKALNLALNKIQGEFDAELLKRFIEDIEPVDLELTGFGEDEIEKIELNIDFDNGEKIEKENDLIICPKCGFKWRKE